MAKKACISKDELQCAKHLRDQAVDVRDYKKALSVILVAELGLDANQTAEVLGLSRRTIFRNRDDICNQDAVPKQSWGGRRHCLLSIEEERQFLAPWAEAATTGGVLTVPPIHAALSELLGHDIPITTTYRLLARHGWRKVQPDTKHPKSDPVAQEEFKKNFPKGWLPPV